MRQDEGELGGAADRKDLKRQRRQAQSAAQQRYEAIERRRRQLVWGGAILVAFLALGGLTYWLSRPATSPAGPDTRTFLIQGQQHIQPGQPHQAYNSIPPTSGWHYGNQVAPWGISTAPIPNEVQVHNIEHGGIMIQYDCPQGCPDVVAKLEALVRSYPSKVVLAPYAGIGRRIALTAWGTLATMDDVDEQFIRRFIDQYKNKGPEWVPD